MSDRTDALGTGGQAGVRHGAQAVGQRHTLDLQGGVHFLMEVDERAAIAKRSDGFTDEIRSVLRESNIPYTSVDRDGQGILVRLSKAEDLGRARSKIALSAPELLLADVDGQPAALRATIPNTFVNTIVDEAIDQNMTTLRNRINALGVAPTGATVDFFKSKGMQYPPEYGPLAAVTPGTPGGLPARGTWAGGRILGRVAARHIAGHGGRW